jgi:transposase
VKRWKMAIDRGGMDALAAKPHPGKPCRLSSVQRRKLVKLLERGPLAAGYETNLCVIGRIKCSHLWAE